MKKPLLILMAVGLIVSLALLQNLFKPVTLERRVFPFYLPWDDSEQTAISMSSRLHKPAGSLGHVYVGEDGHLYVNGGKVKFLGVNICGGACFPEKDEAEKIAGRLAKFGVNVVRFHHMDANWEAFNIFDKTTGGTRRLNKDALDRLDYFISKLKENGIYVDLNLLVSRRFTAADGLPREVETVGWKDQQVLGFFTDEVKDLEKEYARQLLTHLNPYTGMTYAEDPAVAFVEIVNEQGLIHSWLGGVFDRLPQVFRNRLQEKWNAHLGSKYVSDEEFKKAWGVETSPWAQAEVLRNGCFEQGLEGWVVEVHNGAQASARVVEEGVGRNLEIRVTRLGSESWHVQFNQPGLRIREGENYLVRFKARADKTVSVSIGLVQAHEPWRLVSQRVEVPLTTEWREYEVALVASESEDNARLDVSGLGRNIAAYMFSCFSMRLFSGYGAMEDESVEKSTVRILALAEYGLRTSVARRDWVEFLYSMEEEFFTEMRRFIKDELGVKTLVIGTIVGCSTPNIMSKLDVVDTHAYWNHPSFPGTPWDPSNWYVVNEPMVNNPERSTIVGLAVKRVENKPHFVTEYNHPAPNMYDSETVVTLAAYAALQDWDGIFLFDYGSWGNWDPRRIRGFFDIDQHPVKMATLIAAHMIFLRGDVKPADRLVSTRLDRQDEVNLIASGRVYAWALPDAGHMGLNPLASLTHRTAIKLEGETLSGADLNVSGPVYRSDTREVTWDTSYAGRGIITVNTSRSIAAIGFSGDRSLDFGALVIDPGETLLEGWSIITVTVLEGESLESWNRLLLIAAGYVTNTGMRLSTYEGNVALLTWRLNDLADVKPLMEPVTCGANWGSAPTLVEGVRATLRIRTDREMEVWVLDSIGNRVKQVQVSNEGQYKVFSIGPDFQTIWYEMARSETG
ncbi:MAG: carbohydrate binding domain-containing protein [Candidatus Brockarchaeota archaeon]|nr:carbohydrate binding domain-containing protein [Candidatus Brockarchaeota archaeon]